MPKHYRAALALNLLNTAQILTSVNIQYPAQVNSSLLWH